VNAVYSRFGNAGEALPTVQLAALAAELDRKNNNILYFMALINQATKELQVKIVYYGPAMAARRPTSCKSMTMYKPPPATRANWCRWHEFRPHAILRFSAD